MLIKEYRIPMPLSVDEYRIAQLYMIQKKSREESQGTGSGVEIIKNEPYSNGPGGNGQHTQKIYHIGKHIPGWLVSLLPKNALIVEEEAWNAYPYTRTRFTCPFVEKFSIDIETRYLNNPGTSQNVFNLSSAELRNVISDEIDIVKEPSTDYEKKEDPKLYKSKITDRGPLHDDWLANIKKCSPESQGNIMCAYKLCKVEFKYWGMQSKIEKFIHDIGLRKVMLRAHQQAWCWQDEWFGLTMKDIRKLEKETQLALRLKFGVKEPMDEVFTDSEDDTTSLTIVNNDTDFNLNRSSSEATLRNGSSSLSRQNSTLKRLKTRKPSTTSLLSIRSKFSSQECTLVETKCIDSGIEGIRRYSTDTSSDDEFYDATDELPQGYSLADHNPLPPVSTSWSSCENLSEPGLPEKDAESVTSQPCVGNDMYDNHEQETDVVSSCKINILFLVLHGGNALEMSNQGMQSNKQSDFHTLETTFENVISAHYKVALGRVAMRLVACPTVCNEAFKLLQNLSPFGHDYVISGERILSSALVSLFATSSPSYQDTVTSLVVSCNLVYSSFIDSAEGKGFDGQICIISDTIGSVLGYDMLSRCSVSPSSAYNSRRGSSFSNHEEYDDDHTSSVPGSPSLKVSPPQQQWEFSSIPNEQSVRRGSAISLGGNHVSQSIDNSHLSVISARHSAQPQTPQRRSSANCCMDIQRSSSCYGNDKQFHQPLPTRQFSQIQTTAPDTFLKLDFEVTEFFMFGSPLGLVLAMRQLSSGNNSASTPPNPVGQTHTLPKPACHHIYNLFYTADSSSSRIEPLLDMRFCRFPPSAVAKYQIFPLGNRQSIAIGDLLASSSQVFNDSSSPPNPRRSSEWSIISGAVVDQDVAGNLQEIAKRWWGEKRIDYALFHPKAVSGLANVALPHIFHSSFWESEDVAAFILRQVVKPDQTYARLANGKDEVRFTPSMPREKWTKRRNQVKLRNTTSNHRARDSIALENDPQVLHARFMYGPLDMYALNGEKVDIYVMSPPPSSEWVLLSTEVTSSSGKASYTIPEHKRLSIGIHPIKMVVRGDHTMTDSYMAVLPHNTDCVIFSVDGSFTASVSIMGSDPKVRPGAVDVVRFWQDLGYLIIYITARPNMMKQRVVTWLSQHNFPKGLIWFGDGLTSDPLKQKAALLNTLKTEYKLHYAAGYGSSKDIWVYQQLGMISSQIFIVGKTSKKQNTQSCVLSEGYSVHLNDLKSSGGVAPAKTNAQIMLQKGCIDPPGHVSLRKHKSTTIKKKWSAVKSQISH